MDRLTFDVSWDSKEYLACIIEMIRYERDWVPKDYGTSLYIRPWAMSMDNNLDVTRKPETYGLYCVISPVGSYFGDTIKPINVIIDTDLKFIRGNHKSSASFKLGANYAPTVQPQREVNQKGFHNILWTYDGIISEVGVMNLFVVIINDDGEKEIVTPRLDGSILPGITRKSILDLLRESLADDSGNALASKVTEREIRVDELRKLLGEGRVLECFGCGTAVVMVPIKNLSIDSENWTFPVADGNFGSVYTHLYEKLTKIQYGQVEHEFQMEI
jgi:branched-chain amino acid aminotransferase